MANRSYLYATNSYKDEAGTPLYKDIVGISEYGYDIPIAYKLLLSANPTIVRSSIWDLSGDIAILSPFDEGVNRLSAFLDRIDIPHIDGLKKNSLEFLEKHRRKYFLLECGEIFDMEDEDLEPQNRRLLNNIASLDSEIDACLAKVGAEVEAEIQRMGSSDQFLSAEYKNLSAEFRLGIRELGLEYWSDVLYYSPSES